MAAFIKEIEEFEGDVCRILSRLAYHIHPKIKQKIQERNRAEFQYFVDLFADKIDVSNYLFEGSACVFPGVRRYVGGKGKKKAYNPSYRAIIDDNSFPRHIWCFLHNKKTYSGPNWKNSGLGVFELAHIFAHKEDELEFEGQFFKTIDKKLLPYGDFTCACNVILLPKGTVRPTDNSKSIKAIFYMRYIKLYGETTLKGRTGFKKSDVPNWYGDLKWNEPVLPEDWEQGIEALLKYRTKRITRILERYKTEEAEDG
jgi:hypothetical protein